MVTYENGAYWLIFLSNWGITVSFLSNILTLFALIKTTYLANKHQLQGHAIDNSNSHTFMTRFTLAICVIAMNAVVPISFVYWLTIYNGRFTFKQLQLHGLLGGINIIDVIVINCMPIRLKQIFLVYAFGLSFLIWSLIHAASGIGHHDSDNDPETDDDSIYSTLNWNKRPGGAAIMATFLLFIAVPLIFFVLFFLSKLLKPRYCTSKVKAEKVSTDEV